jgi:hypothetical protein
MNFTLCQPLIKIFSIALLVGCFTSCSSTRPTVENDIVPLENYRYKLSQAITTMAPTHSLLVNIDAQELESIYRRFTLYSLSEGLSQSKQKQYKEFGLRNGRSAHTISLIETYMIQKKVQVIDQAIEQIFQDFSEITPDPFVPIRQTAYFGTYTFKGTLSMKGCSDDPDFSGRVKKNLETLKGIIREHFDGYKITQIDYDCVTMNDTFDLESHQGTLDVGYYWNKENYETEKVASCTEDSGKLAPEFTTNWCQDSWNNMRSVKSKSHSAAQRFSWNDF